MLALICKMFTKFLSGLTVTIFDIHPNKPLSTCFCPDAVRIFNATSSLREHSATQETGTQYANDE